MPNSRGYLFRPLYLTAGVRWELKTATYVSPGLSIME